MQQPLLMHINNSVFLREGSLVMIDRRLLPGQKVEIIAANFQKVARAIEDMVVQGAGDIAITAAYGLYLAAREAEAHPSFTSEERRQFILSARERLVNTRPTGHHLKALLDRMITELEWEGSAWSERFLRDIQAAIEKQQRRSELTGKYASECLEDGDVILTHCFPGPALFYMLGFAGVQGKKIGVIATETRPYLQGARLTAWGVSEMELPVMLITDNMAAYCMSQGMISKVFTAADRIAMDGSVANKVGTYQLALAAHYHEVPFYILGYGGPDRSCASGRDIPIEIRDPEEVLTFNGMRTSGERVRGFYPAFDITPPRLVAEIFTDHGVFSPETIDQYWK